MKRIGNIYQSICNVENIKEAIRHAAKHKKNHKYVIKILENEDYYANKISQMLKEKKFTPTAPRVKSIQDASSAKVRTIHKPAFYPDQIVHWALLLQLEPIFMKSMYQYSCGSIPGRGTTYGHKTVRKWLDNDAKHTKYCLKMDVSKFYPSINNDILKMQFRRKLKDKDALWLIDTIVDSVKGQPIGYYTSQWFANFYLEGLDHYIKEELRVKYYVRYVDDLVLFGNNKKKLHHARKCIDNYLSKLKLTVKDNWQVFRVDKRDVDFLGVRFYRNHTTLRRRNSLRIRRRAKKIYKKGYLNEADAQAILSYWGWIKRTDSFLYYHEAIKPYVPINNARRVVSVNAKIRAINRDGTADERGYATKL